MTQYIKKPSVVEAVKYDGLNQTEIRRFARSISIRLVVRPTSTIPSPTLVLDDLMKDTTDASLNVITIGDYLIKNEDGTWLIMSADRFEKLYERR